MQTIEKSKTAKHGKVILAGLVLIGIYVFVSTGIDCFVPSNEVQIEEFGLRINVPSENIERVTGDRNLGYYNEQLSWAPHNTYKSLYVIRKIFLENENFKISLKYRFSNGAIALYYFIYDTDQLHSYYSIDYVDHSFSNLFRRFEINNVSSNEKGDILLVDYEVSLNYYPVSLILIFAYLLHRKINDVKNKEK